MLRLPLVFLLIFSLPVSTFAAMCANGISPDPSQSRVGHVTCNNCSSVTHFARVGGAVLQNNHASSRARYNRVVVSNGRGSSVEVTINQLSSGTGISFSYWLFGYEIRQGNRAQVGVTATPRTGGVSGAPWNRQPIDKGQLRQVCDAIDRERAARQEANKEDDNGNIGEGSSAGRGGYVGQGFDWTGLSLDRFTNTRTGAVYNQFAYRGRIDRGLTLGHRTAIVRDTETNPRTGETYENEYRTDYLCTQRAYKCNANAKQK